MPPDRSGQGMWKASSDRENIQDRNEPLDVRRGHGAIDHLDDSTRSKTLGHVGFPSASFVAGPDFNLKTRTPALGITVNGDHSIGDGQSTAGAKRPAPDYTFGS